MASIEIKCNYPGCHGANFCKIDKDTKNIVDEEVDMDIFKIGTGCAHDEQNRLDVVTNKSQIRQFDERTLRTKPRKINTTG